jgi:superfamily II DNA or RNA helicase
VSTRDGEVAKDILNEFGELWSDQNTLSYEKFIDQYRLDYLRGQMIRQQQRQAVQEQIIDFDSYKLKPNKMQVAFLKSLKELIQNNAERALLLSSTGTGKTLASAFAMREMNPDRILFLVHREQIAKQTIKSYRRVFGSSRKYGLLSGSSRELDAEFLFSTMQMMAKPEIYSHYKPEDFDIIILDECHHSGAASYQRIMRYFQPKLWLGMTASPDTNQYDIYSLFVKKKTNWAMGTHYADICVMQNDKEQEELREMIKRKDEFDIIIVNNLNDIHWRTSKFCKIREALGKDIYSLQDGYLKYKKEK